MYKILLFPFLLALASCSFHRSSNSSSSPRALELVVNRAHTAKVNHVQFSPNGDYLLSASDDNTSKLWDRKERKLIRTFVGHYEYVEALDFHPQGNLFVTGSADQSIRVWNLLQSTAIYSFRTDKKIRSVAFSPNGKWIAYGDDAGKVGLFDFNSRVETQEFLEHSKEVFFVDFDPTGKILFTVSKDRTAILWNTETGEQIRSIQHPSSLYAAALSFDGKFLATGGLDKKVRIWDTATGHLLRSISHSSVISTMQFNQQGATLAVTGRKGNVLLWNFQTGELIKKLRHSSMIESISFHPEDDSIGIGTRNSGVTFWSPQLQGNKTVVRAVSTGFVVFAATSVLNFDSSLIMTPNGSNLVKLIEVESGQVLQTFGETRGQGIYAAGFSHDEKQVITGGRDREVQIWDIESGKLLQSLKGHSSMIYAVAFHPQQQIVASSSKDGTIKVWNLQTGKVILSLENRNIYALAFHPTKPILATSGTQNEIKFWNFETGELLARLVGHQSDIYDLLFSNDGSFLVSGSRDNTLKIWDSETQEILRSLEGHTSGIAFFSFFDSSEEYLLSYGEDGEVKVWDVIMDRLAFNSYTVLEDDELYSIMISPRNYFFAVKKIWHNLHWVQGLKIYPLSTYSDIFFREEEELMQILREKSEAEK